MPSPGIGTHTVTEVDFSKISLKRYVSWEPPPGVLSGEALEEHIESLIASQATDPDV